MIPNPANGTPQSSQNRIHAIKETTDNPPRKIPSIAKKNKGEELCAKIESNAVGKLVLRPSIEK
jgi:hypothetical protein